MTELSMKLRFYQWLSSEGKKGIPAVVSEQGVPSTDPSAGG